MVYKGRSDQGKPVAVKVLHVDGLADPGLDERLEREFSALAILSSPYVVKASEFDRVKNGPLYLAMELLEGRKLAEIIAAGTPPPTHLALKFALQLSLGLEDAHRHGVIHRDVKPDNVIVSGEGTDDVAAKLIDFGAVKFLIATSPRLTSVGMTLGSPNYMSPEQIRGEENLDSRTDQFSLAALVYEAFTGHRAFPGRTPEDAIHHVLYERPRRVPTHERNAVPQALEATLLRGLAKERDYRFPSTREFGEAVAASLGLAEHSIDDLASMPSTALAKLIDQSQPVRRKGWSHAVCRTTGSATMQGGHPGRQSKKIVWITAAGIVSVGFLAYIVSRLIG